MVFEGLSFGEKWKFDKKIADASFKSSSSYWYIVIAVKKEVLNFTKKANFYTT